MVITNDVHIDRKRASGLKIAGCGFVGGDDMTGALHVLELQ